jgi:hypothetical protein
MNLRRMLCPVDFSKASSAAPKRGSHRDGSARNGGIMRLLLGSTAEAVLKNARTAVLAVPLATRTVTILEKAISRAQARRDRLEIKAVERVMKAMRLPARERALRH